MRIISAHAQTLEIAFDHAVEQCCVPLDRLRLGDRGPSAFCARFLLEALAAHDYWAVHKLDSPINPRPNFVKLILTIRLAIWNFRR